MLRIAVTMFDMEDDNKDEQLSMSNGWDEGMATIHLRGHKAALSDVW